MRGSRALAAVTAGLLVAAVVTVVVWPVEDEGARRQPPIRAEPADAPRGSLRVGVPELAATYNPFDPRSRTPAATQVLAVVLPQLFDVAPDGTVQERLVEPGSVRGKGRTVRFRLAEGARWSDGRPVTAADLRFTLDVIRSERWPGPSAGYDRVRSIRGSGRQVVVRFQERLAGWQRLFSGEDFVLPRHRLAGKDLATVWAAGPDVAGGPYVFKGFTPGFDTVLTANPQWWGEGPAVKSIQLQVVPDATTLLQLFERRRLDVAWTPTFTERRRGLAAVEGATVAVAAPGGRLVSMVVNTDEVDEETRRAALDLVDRNRFVDVLLDGEAEVATSWGLLERDPGWPDWFIVPARAEEVGAASLRLVTAEEEPMAQLLTRAVQRRARGTDLSFDSMRVDAELVDGTWLATGEFELAVVDEVQWPLPCWRCRWGGSAVGESNWSRTDDGEVDRLAAAADRGDAEAASRLERRFEEEGVVLPLWRSAAVVASWGVDGVEANSWWPGPLYRPERWAPANA